MEIWQDIPGFDGVYEISKETSFVRSKASGQIKKQSLNNNGYLRVELYKNNKRKRLFVHRIMADLFVANKNRKKFNVVNHLDGNKLNNLPPNLEWTDKSGNQTHAIENGFSTVPKPKLGIDNKQSKLTESDVVKIRLKRKSGIKLKDLALSFGVTETNISLICRRKAWDHVE